MFNTIFNLPTKKLCKKCGNCDESGGKNFPNNFMNIFFKEKHLNHLNKIQSKNLKSWIWKEGWVSGPRTYTHRHAVHADTHASWSFAHRHKVAVNGGMCRIFRHPILHHRADPLHKVPLLHQVLQVLGGVPLQGCGIFAGGSRRPGTQTQPCLASDPRSLIDQEQRHNLQKRDHVPYLALCQCCSPPIKPLSYLVALGPDMGNGERLFWWAAGWSGSAPLLVWAPA